MKDDILDRLRAELPDWPEDELSALADRLLEEMSERVGGRIIDGLSDELVDEYEKLVDAEDHAGSARWLARHRPDHGAIITQVVEEVIAEALAGIRQIADSAGGPADGMGTAGDEDTAAEPDGRRAARARPTEAEFAAMTVEPLTRMLILRFLEHDEMTYRASPRGFHIDFGVNGELRYKVTISVHDEVILRITGSPAGDTPLTVPVREFAENWNRTRRWPMAVVMEGDDGEPELLSDAQFPLGAGIHWQAFHELTRNIMVATTTLFRAAYGIVD